jgi:hypothetical protein
MSIAYFKRERGGVSPVSRVGLHIYRDPPKSITTRKKETVNIGDVLYMVRSDSEYGDPTRINEGIQYFARGQNPMVEVDYGNHSAASQNTSLHNGQATNPYKIEVVRPPLYPVETLVPLSAPRIHQNYSIATNPKIAPVNIATGIDQTEIQKPIIKDIAAGTIKVNPSLDYYNMVEQLNRDAKKRSEEITLRGSIRPTSTYSLDTTRDLSTLRTTAVQPTNVYTVTSNIGGDGQNISNLTMREVLSEGTTKEAFYAPSYTNVGGDRQNISNLTIREVLSEGTTKEAFYAPSYTNVGSSQLNVNNLGMVTTIGANALQDLNSFSVTTNANFGNIVVFDPKTNSSLDVKTTVKDKHYIALQAAMGKPLTLHTNNGVPIHLKDYSYAVVQSAIGNPQFVIQVNQPEVQLDRNTPLYAASSNGSSSLGDHTSLSRGLQEQYNFEKLGSFGEYTDRTSKADPTLRIQQTFDNSMSKKELYLNTKQLAHQMNQVRYPSKK